MAREAREYTYRGKVYTITDLIKLSGLSDNILYRRLKDGWPVEKAVETPRACRYQHLEPKFDGKPLVVIFRQPIMSVFASMQPCLQKEYLAEPHCVSKASGNAIFYIITLDNGKPLIVYPDEFEVISEVN